MKCPNDQADLVMSERQGVEIDYCPQCRGVWLDRGELDKILEKADTQSPPPPPTASPSQPTQYAPDYDRGYNGRGKHRRKSFLNELFD